MKTPRARWLACSILSLTVLAVGGCGGIAVKDADGRSNGSGAPSGGSGSTGETGGTSNRSPSVGAHPIDCGSAVTFTLKPAAHSSPGAFCQQCTPRFAFTVKNASGQTVDTDDPGCGLPSCYPCFASAAGCHSAICSPHVLPTAGESVAWDGTGPAEGTCGRADYCAVPVCVPPGKYTVEMCYSHNVTPERATCTPGDGVCKQVEFTLPMVGTVEATLPD